MLQLLDLVALFVIMRVVLTFHTVCITWPHLVPSVEIFVYHISSVSLVLSRRITDCSNSQLRIYIFLVRVIIATLMQ